MSSPRSGLFWCTIGSCRKTFGRSSDLERHLEECHGPRKECVVPKCSHTGARGSRMSDHLVKKHGYDKKTAKSLYPKRNLYRCQPPSDDVPLLTNTTLEQMRGNGSGSKQFCSAPGYDLHAGRRTLGQHHPVSDQANSSSITPHVDNMFLAQSMLNLQQSAYSPQSQIDTTPLVRSPSVTHNLGYGVTTSLGEGSPLDVDSPLFQTTISTIRDEEGGASEQYVNMDPVHADYSFAAIPGFTSSVYVATTLAGAPNVMSSGLHDQAASLYQSPGPPDDMNFAQYPNSPSPKFAGNLSSVSQFYHPGTQVTHSPNNMTSLHLMRDSSSNSIQSYSNYQPYSTYENTSFPPHLPTFTSSLSCHCYDMGNNGFMRCAICSK